MKITKILPVIILMISLPALGNNIDKLFSNYAKTADTEHIKINKFVTTLLKPFASELKGIDSIEVINLDECSDKIKTNLDNMLKNNNFFNGYETLIRNNDENETSIVLIKIKNDIIKELVVINTGDSHELVRIKVNLNKKQILKLTDKNK